MNSMQSDHDIVKEVSALPGLPVFFNAWWLDIVCSGNKWKYIISRDKKGSINGVLPIVYEQKYGFKISRMPPLTPFLGPWVTPFTGEKNHAKLSHEQQIMEVLISKMPSLSFYSQKFSPLINNWYAFYLKEFSQTTHYTFILENIKDQNQLWDGLKNTVRTVIRNNAENLKIIEEQDGHKLYDLQKNTFARQGKSVPFTAPLLVDLVDGSYQTNSGKTIFIEDKEGNTHAGIFLVWDDSMAYLLVLGMNDQYKNSGGVQVLIWNAIKEISKKVDSFNFEGTMLPKVEPVFRHFGGLKKPYYLVKKDKNLLIKLSRITLGR